MSLMQFQTRTALELSRTRRSADDRYYYKMPEFDSAHAECESHMSRLFHVEWIETGEWRVW